MDRPLLYGQESLRSFDLLEGWRDALIALGSLSQDVNGATTTVVSGFAATQTGTPSLTINLGAGRIYQAAQVDTAAYGTLLLDSDVIMQQGYGIAQTETLTTTGLSAGQSRWALIQAQFQQTDVIRAGDPTGGILNFWNAADPSQPFIGPAGNNAALNTVRQGIAQIQVSYGAVATSGSEVPPAVSGGFTPLYLIHLDFGQSTITNAQILKTGPSIGTGVPSNYPVAPFLTGLLNAHHGGIPGQAPKINLMTEVQGVLPLPNMTQVRKFLFADTTLFVNNGTGNDANDGLTSITAFKTIQAAIDAVYHVYDWNGHSPTIQVADGTYNTVTNGAVARFFGLPVGAAGLNLTGNISTPANVIIQATNGVGITVGLSCNITIKGFTIGGSGTTSGPNLAPQGYGIVVGSAAWANVGNCIFGSSTNGQLVSNAGATITANGLPLTFTGSSPYAVGCSVGGQLWIIGSTITVTGLTITQGFAVANNAGSVLAAGNTFVGSAVGPRYVVALNGIITTGAGGANYFPGNSAGSAITGGQYV